MREKNRVCVLGTEREEEREREREKMILIRKHM